MKHHTNIGASDIHTAKLEFTNTVNKYNSQASYFKVTCSPPDIYAANFYATRRLGSGLSLLFKWTTLTAQK